MLLEVIIIAIFLGLLTGGRVGRLNKLDLKGSEVILIAFLAQLALPFIGRIAPALVPFLLVGSFAVLLLALLSNEKRPAILIMSLGVALNMVVIAANGGMPVRADVLPAAAGDMIHIPISETTRLSWLGDIIFWRLPGPLRGLVSLGDLFLSVGVFALVYGGMQYKGRRRKSP